MGLLDKLPFLGGKSGTSESDLDEYGADIEEYKQTYLTQLRDIFIRDFQYSDNEVNTRVWDDTQGLEVTPAEKPDFQLSLSKEGRLSLKLPKTHPDKDRILKEVEDFFDVELSP